jgi:hypothetical protein
MNDSKITVQKRTDNGATNAGNAEGSDKTKALNYAIRFCSGRNDASANLMSGAITLVHVYSAPNGDVFVRERGEQFPRRVRRLS